jgi:ATP-dependent Clp protease ATP-binding subunit ClpC
MGVTVLSPCGFLLLTLRRIDEIHTLVGAGAVGRGGGGGGGLDISNLMKPALARGELQCIGATTLDEHRKHIEKDQALERWGSSRT